MKVPVLGHICCIKTERNMTPERIQVSVCVFDSFFFSKNLTVAVCSEGLVILGFPLRDRRGFSFQHPPAAEATVVI